MNELKENIAKHIEILCERYPALGLVKKEIVEAYFLLAESYKNGGKLLVAGNGGSAADAEHIVGELMKGFKLPRKPDTDLQINLLKKIRSLELFWQKTCKVRCLLLRWMDIRHCLLRT